METFRELNTQLFVYHAGTIETVDAVKTKKQYKITKPCLALEYRRVINAVDLKKFCIGHTPKEALELSLERFEHKESKALQELAQARSGIKKVQALIDGPIEA